MLGTQDEKVAGFVMDAGLSGSAPAAYDEVRAARIRKIKRQIANNTYKIEHRFLAERILGSGVLGS